MRGFHPILLPSQDSPNPGQVDRKLHAGSVFRTVRPETIEGTIAIEETDTIEGQER